MKASLLCLVGALLALGAVLAALPASVEAQPADDPNFVFILADDMRADDLDYMPATRTLLRREGMLFSQAFVSYGTCCPSRATIMRGQYAHNHGVWYNENGPDGGWEGYKAHGNEQDNVATRLNDAGYRTGLFGKYVNEYNDATSVPPGWDSWFAAFDYRYFDYHVNVNGTDEYFGTTEGDYITDVLARRTNQFIGNSVEDGEPFFAYVAPIAPHGPSVPAPRDAHAFDRETAPRLPSFNEANVSDKPLGVRSRPSISAAERAEIDDRHEGRVESLQALDDLVEDVVERLQTERVLSNTYIIFTSDNGWHHGEHRLTLGKNYPYEESIRVPLVVRGPGVQAGSTQSKLALNTDYLPTFTDLAGAPTPEYVDGRSLRPLLLGDGGPWRTAFLQERRLNDGGTGDRSFYGVRVEDRWKYVEYAYGGRELYDLKDDPYEMENLDGTTQPVQPYLAGLVDALKSCAGATCRAAESPPQTSIQSTGTGAVSVSNSTDATFFFGSSESGSTFECSMDSGTAFNQCSSPKTYSGLASNRRHAFRVRAVDPTGTVDPTPAVHTWTIDTSDPETTLNEKPPRSSTNTSATFRFTGTDNLTAGTDLRFQCRREGGSFVSCSSPQTYTGLGEGSHTFEVRAVDDAGNIDPSPENYTWSVDTTVPETTITDQPAAISSSVNATFEFSSEPGADFECALNSGALAPCTSPKTFSDLSPNREHTFRVVATDEAGNVDPTPARYTWTIDNVEPNTVISGGPGGGTNDDTPTFTFGGSDNLTAAADLRFATRLDGGAWSAFSESTSVTLGGTGGLSQGPHTFYVKAKDQAGNEDGTPAERSFTVDSDAPAAPTIVDPREGRLVSANFNVVGTAEAGSTVQLLEGSDVKGTDTANSSGDWSISLLRVGDGSHTYTARATDEAGNPSGDSNARTVTVDAVAPRVESTVPGTNAKGVARGVTIEILFSEALRGSTVDSSTIRLFRTRSSNPIVSVVQYDPSTLRATLDPDAALVKGRRYKVVVSTEIQDEPGNKLDQDQTTAGLQPKTWVFTVRAR